MGIGVSRGEGGTAGVGAAARAGVTVGSRPGVPSGVGTAPHAVTESASHAAAAIRMQPPKTEEVTASVSRAAGPDLEKLNIS